MSQATPNQPQAQVIRLAKPAGGTTQAVPSQPGAQIQLEFPEGQATFSRSGNDLSVAVDGGGNVTLTNFFVVGNQSLPTLKLADGTEVASADFLAAQNPNMDLTTAAGPGAGAPGSGGEGSYADDPGALLGGIDKLGSLGTVFWDRATEAPETIRGLLADDGGPAGPAFMPVIGITPYNPEFPGGPNDPNYPGDPSDPDSPNNPFHPGLNLAGDRLRMAESVLHDGTAHRHQDGEANPHNTISLRIETNDGLVAVVIDGVRYDLVPDPSDPNHFTLNVADLKDQSGVGHLSGGDVTVEGPGVYRLDIEYTLDTNYQGHGEQGVETDEVGSYEFSAIGNSGVTSAPAVIHIDVIDDIPIARADEAALGSEAASIEGNVVLGTVNGEAVDGAADSSGADHYAATPLRWVDADGDPAMSVTLDNGEKITLSRSADTHALTGSDGKNYGTLELHPDGSYTYTKPGPENFEGQIVIAYTIEDGDGDKASSTLTLKITDSPVIIVNPEDPEKPLDPNAPSHPEASGLGLAAYEKHLDHDKDGSTHDGGAADGEKTWVGNSFMFSAPDGLAGVTINDIIVGNGPGWTSIPGGTHGDLEARLNPATNTVEYRYHLNDNVSHESGDGTNTKLADGKDIADSFKVIVTDLDGDTAGFPINVTIVDDVPTLQSDWATIDGQKVYGNVVDGLYGHKADGSDWGGAAEDGSAGGAADKMGADGGRLTQVRVHTDEKGGTHPADNDPTHSHDGDGTWHVLTEDTSALGQAHGGYSVAVGGLTIYADGYYEYTPTKTVNFDPAYGTGSGVDNKIDSVHSFDNKGITFTAVTVNAAGQVDNSTATFDIEGGAGPMGIKGGPGGFDKTEIGLADNGTDLEGVLVECATPVSALKVDLVHFGTDSHDGAEGPETARWIAYDAAGNKVGEGVFNSNDVSTNGNATVTISLDNGATFGKVVIHAGDTASDFRISGIQAGYQSVSYSEACYDYMVTDNDGDSVVTQLHLHAGQPPAPAIALIPQNLAVHEDALSHGTHAGQTVDHPLAQTGVILVEAEYGLASISVGGHVVGWDGTNLSNAGPWNVDNGTMQIDKIFYNAATEKYEVTFTYTLNQASRAHADTADSHERLSDGDAAAQAAMPTFEVVVTDKQGMSSAPRNLSIDIHDDGPQLGISHADTGYTNGQGSFVEDGNIHLGNTYMTTGSITPAYGADYAKGATYGDTTADYVEVSFSGVRHAWINGVKTVVDSFDQTVKVEFGADGKSGPIYTGLGVIEFSKNTGGSISYTYQAKHGLQNDTETITFGVKDGDNDTARQPITVYMDHDVPAGTSYVDEAGITGAGSHHTGYYDAAQHFNVYLPEGTDNVTWNLEAISSNPLNQIKADVGGSGEYKPVTWDVDGDGNLVGSVDGEPVLTVKPGAATTPELGSHGEPTGNHVADFEVELHHPIRHASGGDGQPYNAQGLYLDFKAEYEGVDDNGAPKTLVLDNAVAVAIVDDAPSAREMSLAVTESVISPEDVYLVMDVSGSITNASSVGLRNGIEALYKLVKEYEAKGIEAKFTLVDFSADAVLKADHLDTTAMLKLLGDVLYVGGTPTYNAAGTAVTNYNGTTSINTWARLGQDNTSTNYDGPLDATQRLVEAAQQDGSLRGYNQKVYFISDGEPNCGLDQNYTSWRNFIKSHGADAGNERVEVYAFGVGNAITNDSSFEVLKGVTGDGDDHAIKVKDYGVLAESLTAVVKAGSATGNLLGDASTDNNDIRSADFTQVAKVMFGDQEVKIGERTEIDRGVFLTVKADGTYTLESSKGVDADVLYKLRVTITDRDGDSSTTTVNLIIQDAKPEAFDSLAEHVRQYVDGSPNGTGSFIVLDNFDNASGKWDASYSAKSGNSFTSFTHGAKVAAGTSMMTIDGTTRNATAADTFVQISARKGGSGVSFDESVRDITGLKASDLTDVNGNNLGLGAPSAGAYIEKSFEMNTAGTLKFNYLLDRGDINGTNGAKEHAFAVLLDAHGKIFWAGKLDTTADGDWDKGVCSIPVSGPGKYTLIIGCSDAGDTGKMPVLYVDQLVYRPDLSLGEQVYHGNMIEDHNPMGERDTPGDRAVLHGSIVVNGTAYPLDADNCFSGEVAGGRLTVNSTGEYWYQTHNGSFDNINIEYTIKEPGSSDASSSFVYIRSDEYVHDVNGKLDLSTDSHNNVIVGHEGNDTIHGGSGNDVIYGGNGDNVLHGGAGNDVIHGGTGNDTIFGGDGNDTIHSGGGHNLIDGGTGHDLIHGGSGNDTIFGGDGNDTIHSGAGNDLIYGGLGADVMYGGSGADTFAWAAGECAGDTASIDKVMDFTLREDRLSFTDLFGTTEQKNISFADVLDAVQGGKIDVTASTAEHLTVKVGCQTVEITLADSHLNNDQLQALSHAHADSPSDDAAKAALLQQMLTNIGG